jgi:hypothetical protein
VATPTAVALAPRRRDKVERDRALAPARPHSLPLLLSRSLSRQQQQRRAATAELAGLARYARSAIARFVVPTAPLCLAPPHRPASFPSRAKVRALGPLPFTMVTATTIVATERELIVATLAWSCFSLAS